MNDRPVAIDLFAGAGGLSEGLMKVGIHVAASVELHPQPALTHAFNHPSTQVFVGDIRELDYSLVDRIVDTTGRGRKVDIVAGGPPCQGFSSAGKKAETDPRNSLFRAFVAAIQHFAPGVFLMENVPGFKSMYGGAVYEEAREAFADLGYHTVDALLSAADFGVPQTRKRFVMVGWRRGVEPFEWPERTHQGLALPDMFASGLPPTPTVVSAIADLSFVEPGFEATRYLADAQSQFAIERRDASDLLFNHLTTRHREKAVEMFSQIRPGGSIRDLPVDQRTKKLTMTRLDPSKVSHTIVSLPDDILHYEQDRILSVRENARLQTFDDDYVFFGKRTSGFVDRRNDVPQYTQVGNAVPPLLGEALGCSILRSLGADRVDVRELGIRRQRHALVRGSSGYAGYVLHPDAEGEIELRTVFGELIPLPVSMDEKAVVDQPGLREWKVERRSQKAQWAPGVESKSVPSWVAD